MSSLNLSPVVWARGFVFLLTLPAYAQINTGAVTRTVADPSHAAIAGAGIEITTENTGLIKKTVSGSVGEYRFDFLPVGNYSLTVEAAGFKKSNFARWRKDGFVSRDAGSEWGKLTTPLVRFNADQMTVNAKIRGEVRLTILDENRKPMEGFREGEFDRLKGDSTAHVIKSKAKISGLRGQSVRFEFSLREGELYAFELA